MDKLRNTICRRLHDLRDLDIQLPAICKKRLTVKLRDLHHGLVLTLRSCQHLILAGIRITGQMTHICNIHTTLHIIACISQILLQYVLHHITAKVANVCKMIDRRSTCIHFHLPLFNGMKGLNLFG